MNYRVVWKTWGSNPQKVDAINVSTEDGLVHMIRKGLDSGYSVTVHDNNKLDDELCYNKDMED